MKKIGIYNLFWDTMGGGEVNAGALAEVLSQDYHVTLLGPVPPDKETFRNYLNIDLSKCEFLAVDNDDKATVASRQFDIFINHTWMSQAENGADKGIYLVMFPRNPRRLRSYIKSGIFRALWMFSRPFSTFVPRLAPFVKAFKRRVFSEHWVKSYDQIISISEYSSEWTKRLWKRDSEVLWPPMNCIAPVATKEKTILSVGRFFPENVGHCKRQVDLVKAFRSLYEAGKVDGWRLVLAGGCAPIGRDYYLQVRKAAEGLPIDVHVNLPQEKLEQLYGQASIYWHATGYGQSARRFPIWFEHYGISVIEAMSAKAVPVVFEVGGPATTVRNQLDGIHWGSLEELVEVTVSLVEDQTYREELGSNAQQRALDFDRKVFNERVQTIFSTDREQERVS